MEYVHLEGYYNMRKDVHNMQVITMQLWGVLVIGIHNKKDAHIMQMRRWVEFMSWRVGIMFHICFSVYFTHQILSMQVVDWKMVKISKVAIFRWDHIFVSFTCSLSMRHGLSVRPLLSLIGLLFLYQQLLIFSMTGWLFGWRRGLWCNMSLALMTQASFQHDMVYW